MNKFRMSKCHGYFFILPCLAVLTIIYYYPIVKAINLSFFDIKMIDPRRKAVFVWLANYREILAMPHFWHSLRVTTLYTAGIVVGTYLIGLYTALLLNQNFRGRTLARSIIILPWGVPYVAVCITWSWMYDYQFGVINYILSQLGIIESNIGWLIDPSVALWSVLVVTIWKFYPIATLMLLAGLQTIPAQLQEAAKIDGANILQRFRYITLPGLAPVSRILILLLIIWGIGRIIIVIYLLTEGGPVRATETLILQTYLRAFSYFQMSYAATLATMILVMSILLSFVYLLVLRHGGES